MTPDFIGAFVVGLLGAGHCIGMCGGLASLLTLNSPANHSVSPLLFYNVGRIVSYSVFGAIVAGLTASLSQLASFNHSLVWLRVLSAVMMIILALDLHTFCLRLNLPRLTPPTSRLANLSFRTLPFSESISPSWDKHVRKVSLENGGRMG